MVLMMCKVTKYIELVVVNGFSQLHLTPKLLTTKDHDIILTI